MRTFVTTAFFLVIISTVPFTKARLFDKKPLKAPTPDASASTIDAADQCVETPKCDQAAKWRSFDGSCNNLVFPMWGQAKTALTRLAPAQYDDGIHSLRKSRSGKELPNARRIVLEAFSFNEVPDHINSMALMSVGQLISHDASLIGASPDPSPTCCEQGGPNCINIEVSRNDPFYKEFNVTCLPLDRAPTTAALGCSLQPEYTLTEVSHFIDASFVYGSSNDDSNLLREKNGGRLKEQIINGQSYPPQGSGCFGPKEHLCMVAGDVRANQNPPLGALQIIMFREHNRVAAELSLLNPDWDDEKVFQETRRIVIGEWQIIVYRDWLPFIIGLGTLVEEKLLPNLVTMSDDYDQLLNPSTTNDFTTAAYRIFHSQVPSAYCAKGAVDSAKGCPFGANKFSNSFDHPQILATKDGFNSVLFGLDRQNAEKIDTRFTVELSGKLFRHGSPFGLDLIATDIVRGRDNGLPPYNKYRSLCGLRPARIWEQLLDVLSLRDMQKLRAIYESPDDIDLYVAGAMEKKFGNALVGPTFQCLLVDQFRRWMKGDRYFVDFKGFPHSLSPQQVKALGGTSLARMFCDNEDGITDVPRDIFLLKSERVSCEKLPRVDLSPWKESTLRRIVRKVISLLFPGSN